MLPGVERVHGKRRGPVEGHHFLTVRGHGAVHLGYPMEGVQVVRLPPLLFMFLLLVMEGGVTVTGGMVERRVWRVVWNGGGDGVGSRLPTRVSQRENVRGRGHRAGAGGHEHGVMRVRDDATRM